MKQRITILYLQINKFKNIHKLSTFKQYLNSHHKNGTKRIKTTDEEQKLEIYYMNKFKRN